MVIHGFGVCTLHAIALQRKCTALEFVQLRGAVPMTTRSVVQLRGAMLMVIHGFGVCTLHGIALRKCTALKFV